MDGKSRAVNSAFRLLQQQNDMMSNAGCQQNSVFVVLKGMAEMFYSNNHRVSP
jgi:hypothetical protein